MTRLASIRILGFLAVLLAARAWAQEIGAHSVDARDSQRIRDVRILTRDVFAHEEAADRPVYRLVNGLHIPTRESVVRRELWFGAGDAIDEPTRAELERNLRGTGLFGAVEVRLEPTETQGEVDLVIDTRDRLSLVAVASGSVVGGVGGYNVLVGERNFLGTGDEVTLSISGNSEDETEFVLDYDDRHVFDSWYRLNVSVGETEEGPFLFAGLRRPFKHLADPRSWGISVGYVEDDVDFFERGESVAQVPNESMSFGAFAERAWGRPELRKYSGLSLRFNDTSYGTARGPSAGTVDVPGDLTQASFGPYGRVEWAADYLELEGIDSLDYVQDVRLGARADLFVGAIHRDESGEDERVEASLFSSTRAAFAPFPDTYVSWQGSGTGRWYAGDALGWNLGAALHAYQMSLPRQTLAFSLTYDKVIENENLRTQLNLGEDNGLRGYPAREFAGQERIRLNVENRIDTGLEWRSLHFGLVAFYDAGWIGLGARDLGDPLQSVGVGLRIGSSEVFGSGVVRIDFAVPLDDGPDGEYDPSLSIAWGQVFDFFGNSSTLSSR